MSWITVIEVLTKGLELKDAYGAVEGVWKYGEKISKADPKKLEWKDVKIFDSPIVSKAKAASDKELKRARAAASAKFEVPESGATKLWMDAYKAMVKYGEESNEYKKAMAKYIVKLELYDNALKALRKDIDASSAIILERKIQCDAFIKYAGILEKAFAVCIKISLNDAERATFFVLSRDCANLSKTLKQLVPLYKKIKDAAFNNSRTVAATIKTNREWIEHSKAGLFSNAKTMSKNSKALRPKK